MHTLHTIWNKLIHIGMNSTMSYVDKKRIIMVNIIALSCIPFMTYFAINNFLEHRYLLATINLTNTLTSIITLFLQHYRKYKFAKITLLTTSYVCFFAAALLFQNGTQYYILSILIISALLHDDYRIHLISSIFVATAIIIIELFSPLIVLNNPIPKSRIIFNIIGSISFIIVAIQFYLQIMYNKMKKIEDQRLRLHIANQEKERIFSIIAHDIKSPFLTLENLANILHLKISNQEETEQFAKEICHKIHAQNKVLDDLLKWGSANIKGGKKATSMIVVQPLIKDIISFFTEQYTQKQIKINTDIPKTTQVYANPDHLTIILRNIISNAIKFSHTKGEISIYSKIENQNTLIFIEDNGIGINEIKKSLLFSEIQNRSLGTSNEPGSGFGLVLCRDLINQNNGTITIESKLEKGTIFKISLPNNLTNINYSDINKKTKDTLIESIHLG